MPAIPQTTSITIDESVYEVAKMSQEVQQMVTYLDEWRQKEADLSSDLLMTRAALRDLQNTLLETIQRERAEAQSKAEALGIVAAPTAAPEPTAVAPAVVPAETTKKSRTRK